jgi:2-polyprenyl-6-methoxyphenol hydroxylase-like FAD-dependent oxidoreductase
VGLVLALELAEWQVPVLVVERHLQPSPFPRGRAISTRSMKILRQLGVEQELTAMGLPLSETAYFFPVIPPRRGNFGRVGIEPVPWESGVSLTATLPCPQDRLETLLRDSIAGHPMIEARFGVEMPDARHHSDHVELRPSDSTELPPGWSGERGAARERAGRSDTAVV